MEIEIGRLFRAIRRYWWLAALGVLVVAAIVAAGSSMSAKNYTATTRMLIVPSEIAGSSVFNGSPSVLIDLADSRTVLEQVISDNDLDFTYSNFMPMVFAAQQSGTQYILISVTHEDPETAAELSLAVAQGVEARANEMTLTQFTQRQSALEFQSNSLAGRLATIDAQLALLSDSDAEDLAQIDTLNQQRLVIAQQKADVDRSLRDIRAQISSFYSEVSIVDQARVPQTPDGFGSIILAIVGGFVGAVIGSAAILFMAIRDNTVVNAAQVARIVGKPVLREMKPGDIDSGMRLINRLFSDRTAQGDQDAERISLVAPTALKSLSANANDDANNQPALMPISNGVVRNDDELGQALDSSAAVMAVQVGVTRENELREAVEYLRVAGIPVLGSIVFKGK